MAPPYLPCELGAVRWELLQQFLHDFLADRIRTGCRLSLNKKGTNLGGECSIRREVGWNSFGRQELLP